MPRSLVAGALALAVVASACGSGDEAASSTTQAVAASTTEAVAPTTTTGASEPDPNAEVATTVGTNDGQLGETTTQAPSACTAPGLQGRVDVGTDGNRLSAASIELAGADVIDVVLPSTIDWVVPTPDGGWFATTQDGRSFAVSPGGDVEERAAAVATPPVVDSDGSIGTAFDEHPLFDDPLLDGRVVQSDSVVAVLSSPTDRYAHNVLGDAIEGSAVEWVDVCDGASGRIDIAAPDVIEGVAPMLADIDDDGTVEVIVTLSNSSGGARLAAYELDGTLRAESAPIGQGNRWRNQLAVGPFGPNGETEILDVQTPHIGGILQAFQLVEGDEVATLERVAQSAGAFTSHPIRTRNLDMGIALDVNADGASDALVSAFERDRLIGMTRSDDPGGWTSVVELALPGVLTSNIAVSTFGDPAVAAGAGSTLRIWTQLTA